MPVTEQWTNPDLLRWVRERIKPPTKQVAEESK